MRHPDVDVDPVALPARRIHPLEPQRRPAAVRVDQVLVGTVAAVLVTEHGTPERHHLGADERVDRDLDGLHRGRVGGHAQRSSQHHDDIRHPRSSGVARRAIAA
jgi:hypothetical protein